MEKQLKKLIELINEDYRRFMPPTTEVRKQMNAEFAMNIEILEGRKYYKIIKGGSVWGFVMKADDQKFKAGDLLKAASWAAPARNKARGNILKGDYSWVRWTGPEYL
tara:strand:- start:1812 stop:2132 length:321 start_codon:yes stop_codon:yes gene_type:complete